MNCIQQQSKLVCSTLLSNTVKHFIKNTYNSTVQHTTYQLNRQYSIFSRNKTQKQDINNRPYPILPSIQPYHKSYKPLSLYPVTSTSSVPSHIERPDYALSNGSKYNDDPRYSQFNYRYGIEIKTDYQIQLMIEINSLVSYVRSWIQQYIKPGITTDELDKLIHSKIITLGAYPSPLYYAKFPKSCCTSINQVVCHGM